ncbi:hypothetical protein KOI35_02715 [Actinoplanes bogorensis]|uniref:Uncharacterized protein n=1 Tax=Paractinoplanes bogorensis TaxID=1610840 RepID=A0ABS5YKD3_9ACTN|nr:hypothetical protein [Actinoplanes bogorensis]MBU2662415.1 hypothetical protein [Actinoplanes bogorensis]
MTSRPSLAVRVAGREQTRSRRPRRPGRLTRPQAWVPTALVMTAYAITLAALFVAAYVLAA